MANKKNSIDNRFWDKVQFIGHPKFCWVWIGAKDENGYGAISRGGRGSGNARAHVVSFQITGGTLRPGQIICHRCDNPPCVNPDHLFAGTHQDNVDDMRRKGRHIAPIRPFGETHHWATLSNVDVLDIREKIARGDRIADLAKIFDVSVSLIYQIKRREIWKSI